MCCIQVVHVLVERDVQDAFWLSSSSKPAPDTALDDGGEAMDPLASHSDCAER
jgi:hypothetical protein